METPNILRETKGMQKGFVKEDVLMYLDELNTKIAELQNQANEASGQKPADNQEIIKYRNQIDNLQEKLNASNNALRVAKKENEELQQQIAKLKAGGAAPAGNAAAVDSQTKAALEAARKEIDSLRNQLKAANDKIAAAPAANAGNQAASDASKKEIDSLKEQLKIANDKAAAAEALKAATKAIDMATSKGVYHKNTASRKVSRLAASVNKMA